MRREPRVAERLHRRRRGQQLTRRRDRLPGAARPRATSARRNSSACSSSVNGRVRSTRNSCGRTGLISRIRSSPPVSHSATMCRSGWTARSRCSSAARASLAGVGDDAVQALDDEQPVASAVAGVGVQPGDGVRQPLPGEQVVGDPVRVAAERQGLAQLLRGVALAGAVRPRQQQPDGVAALGQLRQRGRDLRLPDQRGRDLGRAAGRPLAVPSAAGTFRSVSVSGFTTRRRGA